MAARPRLLVAVPTLGVRPISRLLMSLAQQKDSLRAQLDITLLVLHNSPTADPSIREQVEEHGARYALVPELGYSRVRNAALDLSRGHDFLTFIDDDEIPDNAWLQSHWYAANRWVADIVFGPVHAMVPAGSPEWLDGGRLLREPTKRADGLTEGAVFSGNTTLRLQFVDTHRLRFDRSFDATGGEDTDFFTRCRLAGARIIWSNSVALIEYPDVDRLTLKNLLRRSFQSAHVNTRYRVRNLHAKRLPIAFRKIGQMGRGSARACAGIAARKPSVAARGVRDFALATGSLRGLVTIKSQDGLSKERKSGVES